MSFVINDPDYSEDDSEFNPSFDEQEDESEKSKHSFSFFLSQK